ncbi:MAG: GAF domain-containing protein [Anaerolineaceae bacterium]|nr:GAF domain-containing protein [Anaerolineaceae bacterium]
MESNRKQLRILILEDDPMDAELEVARIEAHGYEIQWERVEEQKDFVARLQGSSYDLILSDYQLPAFDGLSALKHFLQKNLEIPFILVSGVLGEENAIESLKAGATDYVLKENLSRLGPVVDRALKEKNDQRQRRLAEQRSERLLSQQIAANKLSLSLGESRNLFEIFQIIYKHVSELMDIETFIVAFYDRSSQLIDANFIMSENTLLDTSNLPAIPLAPEGYGTQSKVIRSGKPLYLPDYRKAMEHTKTEYTVTNKKVILKGPPPEEDKQDSTNSSILVPMKDKGETIGVMQVQSHHLDGFSQEDIDLLAALANVASIAIQNARLLEETQLRMRELEMVNRVSIALRTLETLDEMLPVFLDETLSIMNTTSGNITLFDKLDNRIDFQICRGWFDHPGLMLLALDIGVAGQVIKTGRSYISKEFVNESLIMPESRKLIPPNWGGACLPIHAGVEIIGLFYISVELPRQLESDDIRLLGTLSEIIGNAVHRTRLHEQTRRQVQNLAALRVIDNTINASLDMDIISIILVGKTKEQLGVDAVRLLKLDPHNHVLVSIGSLGFDSKICKNGWLGHEDSYAGKVVFDRQGVFIPDLAAVEPKSAEADSIEKNNFNAYFALPLIAKGHVMGVLEIFNHSVIHPDLEWLDFFNTLAGQAAIAIDNTSLFHNLQKSNQDLALAYDSTLEGWAKALELRDNETEGHSQRVTRITIEIARKMGMSPDELVHVRRGALLHDIGKMGIPDSILLKPGPLTDEEWVIMRQHPVYALNLISPIAYLRPAIDIPYSHHEKWDGTGYPIGLKGEKISLAARIFAIVDVWDALLSDRPYRKAWSKEKTIECLRKGSGKHFDPAIMEVFLEHIKDDTPHDSI